MFGPTFGKSADQIAAMGLSTDAYVAEKQVATGNYNPNAVAPIKNTATVGTTGMLGGARMSDADVSSILSGMKSGTIDAKTGALKLSQGQVNLYDMARISGETPEAIQAAAAANGIRIQDVLGQKGVIQQGGLLSGMNMADAAKSQGGAMVNVGTAAKPTMVYQGPQGSSFVTDLSRMTMGAPQTPVTVQNWADTARNTMDANIAANGAAAADRYNAPVAPSVGATTGPIGLITAPVEYRLNGPGEMRRSPVDYSLAGPATNGFDPATDTTRGQVDSMLQKDSEYLQNARTGAMQMGNARGLLNSSITAGAGEKVAIDAAALIGDATANQYQKAKITTQELSNRMDLANLDADTRMKIAQIDSAYKDKALASGDNQNALGNYRAIADNTNRMIQEILTSATLTPEAKQQAIDSVLMRHDEYLQFQDGITGLNLSSLITYTG